MAVNPDGSFLVAGYAQSGGGGNAQGYLARYSATGVLDTTFANQGVLLFSFPGDGGTNTIQSYCSDGSGGCYVGGQTGNVKPAIITHVTSAGTIDTTFGTSGYTQTTGSGIIGIGVQSTGAIVYWDGAHVNRLLSSGQPDSSFTSVALSATSSHANAFAVDNEDRILVLVNPMAGTKAVYRINPNGGLDTTFASGGHYAISNGYALCVFADNSIAVGGGSNAFVTKSSSAGLLDTTFGTGGTTTFAPLNSGNWIYGMTLLPSRQIASVGTGYDGVSYWYIVVILNANGTFDTYFSIPGQSTSVGAGTAQYRIPTGTSGTAFSVGSLPLSNQLVVAGASGYGSGNVTLMFYLVGA